jgi:putative SOS response-associated peptidase YedK
MRWGLVPFWAKDQAIGNKIINARPETLADTPPFQRPSFLAPLPRTGGLL